MSGQQSIALWSTDQGITNQNVVSWMMHEIPDGGIELGLAPEQMVRLVQRFKLTSSDLSFIVDARKEYNANLDKIKSFLSEGMKAEDAHGLYAIREVIQNDLTTSISVELVKEVCQSYGLPFNDSAAEVILETVGRLRGMTGFTQRFGAMSGRRAMGMLLMLAESHDGLSIVPEMEYFLGNEDSSGKFPYSEEDSLRSGVHCHGAVFSPYREGDAG